MSENTIITINNVKLSRGMTVDYEKGDPVILEHREGTAEIVQRQHHRPGKSR